jgi:hypothetical protein
VGLLKRARALVEQADLPVELRVSAFEHVIAFLAGAASGPVFEAKTAAELIPDDQRRPTADRRSILARRLGINVDVTDYVYDVGSELTLVLARSRLPSQKARATRMVAVLYAAGRQAAYEEEWTLVELIREQCRISGVLDPPNFSASLGAASDSLIMRGRGNGREVKVTRAGFEEAGRLAAELTVP